ncbi:MAG: S41 family peptidase [Alphaproteobacteria bacterium]|nr:S41 family peptidase [Alphaproteobacteria bacterium]
MNKKLVLAAIAALVLTLPIGILTAQEKSSATYRQLNLFGDVFERVRADYVEEVSDKELIENAINGMLTALDPHSSYLNEKNYRDMQVQTKGEFGGLGIEVTLENGLVKVVSPIDDTPAFRAGIQPQDLITHLDGEQVLGLTLQQAVERMRGKVDTDIRLTIRRKGRKPFDVTLTRAIIKIRSVRSRIEQKNIGYVRITSFNEQTHKGLIKAMENLRADAEGGLKGIVLDLRNNPGGLLDQAVAVADAFLDKGEIVSTRSRRKENAQRFNARPGDLAKVLPIVVLINGGSASASEIVAGALQDHGRAIIMGTRSFGKGSVQTIVPLPGQGAMRLTTSRYYTPSGRSIQAKGIDPDIVIEQSKVEPINQGSRRSEADLRGALTNDSDGDAPKKKDKTAKKDEKKDEKDAKPKVSDYQLNRAVDLLRGIALFSRKSTD